LLEINYPATVLLRLLVLLIRPPPLSTLFPYTTLFRSMIVTRNGQTVLEQPFDILRDGDPRILNLSPGVSKEYVVAWTYRNKEGEDRKSTRLNSSHVKISYAVFCLKKKTKNKITTGRSI